MPIRLSTLTKEQEDIEIWSYEAMKVLKENGFDCTISNLFVTSPKDYPTSIHIIGKSK